MKVAISGAGVAGPTLAFWLLRGGHEPTLIEVAPKRRSGGYMIDFWGVGYDVAERMGVLPAVHAAGFAVDDVRWVDRRGRTTARIGAATLNRELGGRFVSLPRGRLAGVLSDAVQSRAQTLFGVSIVALAPDADGVGVRLSDGRSLAFDIVVGADGLHSGVRALAFGPQAAFERSLGYCVGAFEAQGYRPRDELAYVSHGQPGRQISRFALEGDRTMFLFVFAEERLNGAQPRTLPERKAALTRVFAGMGWEWPAIAGALAGAGEVYFDRVSQIVAPSWSKGRVALVGDAAACVSLVAGEGTGLAMAEAYVLAGEISRGGDPAAALVRYEARMRAFVEGKQRGARTMAGWFAPRTTAGLWMRDRAAQLLALPGLPDLLLRAQLRDDFALPDYERMDPAATARAALG